MSMMGFAAWAFAAGALIPLMAVLNAGLARGVGGFVQATVLLFAVGLLASLALAVAVSARIPGAATLASIAPRQYAGGLIVAFYVVSITFLAPRIGVGSAIMLAVTAQLLTSAVIDHYALAGAALRPLTLIRGVGLVIVVIGVVVSQAGDRIFGLAR
jgi:transporter family-2 protein